MAEFQILGVPDSAIDPETGLIDPSLICELTAEQLADCFGDLFADGNQTNIYVGGPAPSAGSATPPDTPPDNDGDTAQQWFDDKVLCWTSIDGAWVGPPVEKPLPAGCCPGTDPTGGNQPPEEGVPPHINPDGTTTANPWIVVDPATGEVKDIYFWVDGIWWHCACGGGGGAAPTYNEVTPSGDADSPAGPNTLTTTLADGSKINFCEGVNTVTSAETCQENIGADSMVSSVAIDGKNLIINSKPEHDQQIESGTFGFAPVVVDNSEVMGNNTPTDILVQDLGECANPFSCRTASLVVIFEIDGGDWCVPDGVSVLVQYLIKGSSLLSGPQGRIAGAGAFNRSFDACYNGGDPILITSGGASLTLATGATAPGGVIDLGDFTININYAGFQENTADSIIWQPSVYTGLRYRCIWTSEKEVI